MTKKAVPTIGVFETITGFILLETGGASRVHEVMDVLYPGIMTMGIAAMAKTAGEELRRQLPEVDKFLNKYPIPRKDGAYILSMLDEYAAMIVSNFGVTLEIEGPHVVTKCHVAECFAKLRKGAAQ